VPFEQLDELLQEFPQLTQEITSYVDFASRSVEDLFGTQKIEEAEVKKIQELRSVVFFNRGNGDLDMKALPLQAQSFPVKAIQVIDGLNSPKQVILGGNHFAVKQSMGGRQDAGYGLHLTYSEGEGFSVLSLQDSGFFTEGEVRSIHPVRTLENELFYLIGKNNQPLELFKRN